MSTQTLESFLKLVNEYQLYVQLGSLQIQSIANGVKQRKATELHKRNPTTIINNQIIIDLENLQKPQLHLDIFDTFPDLADILLLKQTQEIETHFQSLQETLLNMEKTIDQMAGLERIAMQKSKYDKVISPTDIPFLQVYEWLEKQAIGYKMDLADKLDLVEKIDIDGLGAVQSKWELCDSIDFKNQTSINERIKISKIFA
ncbi:hypothetical protein HDV01_001398 [Terramyces sp. JEL0728]|nr:hypothetical protein HDV01_001398 [Terramyces sp. JEL0728]